MVEGISEQISIFFLWADCLHPFCFLASLASEKRTCPADIDINCISIELMLKIFHKFPRLVNRMLDLADGSFGENRLIVKFVFDIQADGFVFFPFLFLFDLVSKLLCYKEEDMLWRILIFGRFLIHHRYVSRIDRGFILQNECDQIIIGDLFLVRGQFLESLFAWTNILQHDIHEQIFQKLIM